MNKLLLLMSLCFLTGYPATDGNTKSSFVGVCLPKIMSVIASQEETAREQEADTAVLLYPTGDRLEDIIQRLKNHIKNYEASRRVRVDILTASHEMPDYTEDFLNWISKEEANHGY